MFSSPPVAPCRLVANRMSLPYRPTVFAVSLIAVAFSVSVVDVDAVIGRSLLALIALIRSVAMLVAKVPLATVTGTLVAPT